MKERQRDCSHAKRGALQGLDMRRRRRVVDGTVLAAGAPTRLGQASVGDPGSGHEECWEPQPAAVTGERWLGLGSAKPRKRP